MANTFSQIYLQTVFAVKYRAAVLDIAWRSDVQGIIGKLINDTGCKTIIVNGVDDHMHCYFGLRPAVSVSELMKTVKGKYFKYINDNHLTKYRFEWQTGFGVFSYRQRDVHQIYNNVKNQEGHHKKQSFRDEYLELLQEFELSNGDQYTFQVLI